MPNPTPKPTAEERFDALVDIGLYQMNDQANKAAVIAALADESNRATRQAFEEAAAMTQRKADNAFDEGEEEVLEQLAAEFRALAKEKPS